MKKTNVTSKMAGVAVAALAVVAVGTGSASASSTKEFSKALTGNQAKYQWDNFVKWVKSWF